MGPRPDVVLLHIGINDLNRGIDPAHAPDRLRTLVDRVFADRPGVTVLMLGCITTTPGLESAVAAYNAAAKALAGSERRAGRKMSCIDPPALTSAEMADGLHPDDAGHRRMAQAFFPALDAAVTGGWAPGGPARSAGTEAGTGKVRFVDLDGEGRADYVYLKADGAMDAYFNRGGDGSGGWLPYGRVATGLTSDASRVALADFAGDGNADYLLTDPAGHAVTLCTWLGGDGHGGWSNDGQVAAGVAIA